MRIEAAFFMLMRGLLLRRKRGLGLGLRSREGEGDLEGDLEGEELREGKSGVNLGLLFGMVLFEPFS